MGPKVNGSICNVKQKENWFDTIFIKKVLKGVLTLYYSCRGFYLVQVLSGSPVVVDVAVSKVNTTTSYVRKFRGRSCSK